MQKQIVEAQQGVQIAERIADAAVKKANGEAAGVKVQAEAEAQRVKLIAQAEAEKLRVMGNAEAERTKAVGDAEASKILAIGKSNAQAYEEQVKAIGGDGFVKMKVAEIIGEKGVKIIPDVLITGGGEGGGSNVIDLLGLKLLENWGKDKNAGLPEA